MPNQKPKGNIYDRIFRENANHLFIPLIQKLYNLDFQSYQVLDPNFPSTSENEVDFTAEKDMNRYINQLFFLSRLRKFEEQTKHTLNNMLIEVDIEKDYFYLQGLETGKEAGIEIGQEEGKDEGLDLGIKVIELHKKGTLPKAIAKKLDINIQKVMAIIKVFKAT